MCGLEITFLSEQGSIVDLSGSKLKLQGNIKFSTVVGRFLLLYLNQAAPTHGDDCPNVGISSSLAAYLIAAPFPNDVHVVQSVGAWFPARQQ